MARVTVEDCIVKVPNRFELVMLAGRRAKDLASGATLTIERGRDKNPVVALREIAQATVSTEALEDSLIRTHQKSIVHEEAEQEIVDLMKGEQAWANTAEAEAAERMAATGGMDGFEAPEETDDTLDEAGDGEGLESDHSEKIEE